MNGEVEMHDSALASLAGRTGWVVTDGKAGMVVQARGVADALGLDYVLKTVKPRGLARWLAPWGPVGSRERFGEVGSEFAPPWPAVAIATGRASIPYMRALRRAAGMACYTVVLQDPRTGPNTADLVWVPQHDRLRGPNVITTLTSPHSFSRERITELRAAVPTDIARLPKPRVSVVLGGRNAAYKYRDEDYERLQAGLGGIAALGASFMITTSRRTHERLLDVVDRVTARSPRILWTGDGANPYADFLAHADNLVVTADSVNMTGEACATGRPVYVFTPSGGTAKFSSFHEGLRKYGATRELPAIFDQFEDWSYEPLDSARLIASEVLRRWQRRCEVLPTTASR